MRREGYELSVGKPQVILRDNDGVTEEPVESLVVEVPHDKMGPVMEMTGARRGKVVEVNNRGEFASLLFSIPARGLIGLRTKLLNATQGTAIIHHRFESYQPLEAEIGGRANGVLVSMCGGKTVAFGLDGLQARADLFVGPGEEVYEGMIVGENAREGDMNVNPTKEKKLTNMRASGSDRNILLKPPREMSLKWHSSTSKTMNSSKSRRTRFACVRFCYKKPNAVKKNAAKYSRFNRQLLFQRQQSLERCNDFTTKWLQRFLLITRYYFFHHFSPIQPLRMK